MTDQHTQEEFIDGMKTLPVLDFFEQMEVLSKARLSLMLKAPDVGASLEEKMAFHEEQRERILSFANLLYESLVSEHGKPLLCLYQCE